MSLSIVSTMGSGSIGRELDLTNVVDDLQEELEEDLDVNFQSSGMVTVRSSDGPAIIFYRTGSFQIRGASSPQALVEAKEWILDMLHRIGVETPSVEFEQRTAVFQDSLDHTIDLEMLADALGFDEVEYEPEQFPALIYQPGEHGCTVLIFGSGKLIVTGTTVPDVAKNVVQSLANLLESTPG